MMLILDRYKARLFGGMARRDLRYESLNNENREIKPL